MYRVYAIFLALMVSLSILEAGNDHKIGIKVGLTSIKNKESLNFKKSTLFIDMLFDTPTFIKPRIDLGYINIDEEDKGGVSSLLQLALNGLYEFNLKSYNTPLKPYILAGLGYEKVFDKTPVFKNQIYAQGGFGFTHPLGEHIDFILEFRALQIFDKDKSDEDNEFVFLAGISVPLFVEVVREKETTPIEAETIPTTHYEPVQLDGDQDMVPDDIDKCPNTPLGKEVDSRGCMIVNAIIIPENVEYVQESQIISIAPKEQIQKTKPIYNSRGRNNLQLHFKSNSAAILPKSKDRIKKFASYLKSNPTLKVTIEGYTDSSGLRYKNLALSKQRAKAVRAFLIRYGVDGSRLKAIGKGDVNPIADNDTEEGRAKNRRIEAIIY